MSPAEEGRSQGRPPDQEPLESLTSQRRSGLLRRAARMLANLVYRDIDIQLPDVAIPDGPVLAVANHFGGLADAVLLVDSLPRMPRVVARDVIFKIPVVGQAADFLGGIPVHRRADGAPMSNDETFGSCYRALAAGELVLIFPEGVTQDVPHMAKVRTGAARIALGAAGTGVSGIRILPVGIHYENKAGFRSRALVNVGAPLDLDRWLGSRSGTDAEGAIGPGGVTQAAVSGESGGDSDGHDDEEPEGRGADDRRAVADLTALIDRRLRLVAPDHPDWGTSRALSTAAEVLLHDVDPGPEELRFGDLALVSSGLGRARGEPDAQGGGAEVVALADEYRRQLERTGCADRAVRRLAVGGSQARDWLLDVLLVCLLAPFALAGLMAAALPLVAVTALSRAPLAPAIRASLVPAVALLLFVIEGVAFAAGASVDRGWQGAAGGLILFPYFVAAFFLVHERVVLLWRRWRARRIPSGPAAQELARLRDQVSASGWALL